MTNKLAIKFSIVFFFVTLGLSIFLLVTKRYNETNFAFASERKLLIYAEADDSPSANTNQASKEELGGNFNADILYNNLKNVVILIKDTPIPLEKAICDGHVTVEELEAYAEIDARNGICKVEKKSQNGLTNRVYQYPEFYLRVVNDLYETPDGKQHDIHRFDLFSKTDTSRYPKMQYNLRSDSRIDREDWGLSFEVLDTTSTSIRIRITQANGQQFGHLRQALGMTPELYCWDNDTWIHAALEDGNSLDINMDAITDVSFRLENTNATLVPGTYSLHIFLEDFYDATTLHPLTQNYYDRQVYIIDDIIVN